MSIEPGTEALGEWLARVEAFPEDAEANLQAGWRLAEAGRTEEGRRQAIILGHPGGRAYAQLALAYQRQGKRGAARTEAKRALRHPLPHDWRPWVSRIVTDCRPGRR